MRLQRDFILAGGLDADNIRHAIETVRPLAVDVNSGIERSPGCKDHARLRELVAQVRMIEQAA
jgi:phosphoribosylanthranilate isomerase